MLPPICDFCRPRADASELHVGQRSGRGGADAFAGEIGLVGGRIRQQWVERAFMDDDIGVGRGTRGMAVGVIGKASGDVLPGSVVVQPARRDGLRRHAGVDLLRLPGENAFGG